MLKRLAKFLIVLALASSIGLHWMALQSVAWTAMLAGNLRSNSISQAVHRTFDGQHPCCLCKAIQKAKAGERKSAFFPHLQKLEFPPNDCVIAMDANATFPPATTPSICLPSLASAPPLPPPRSVPV